MATGETTSTRSARSDASVSADDDKRLAFVYQEAVRGLQHHQYVVESLNNRGGNLIFATAFATSLLGTRALSDGVGFLDWIAVCLLFLVGALIVFMLWPYYNFTFRFDPEQLLTSFVDRDKPATMSRCTAPWLWVSRRTWPTTGGSSSASVSLCSCP